MTRALFLSAVALATGENLRTIERIGFGHKSRTRRDEPTDDDPLAVIDCPCCGGTVVLAWNRTDALPDMAECRTCDIAVPYSPAEVYEVSLDDVVVPTPCALASAA